MSRLESDSPEAGLVVFGSAFAIYPTSILLLDDNREIWSENQANHSFSPLIEVPLTNLR